MTLQWFKLWNKIQILQQLAQILQLHKVCTY